MKKLLCLLVLVLLQSEIHSQHFFPREAPRASELSLNKLHPEDQDNSMIPEHVRYILKLNSSLRPGKKESLMKSAGSFYVPLKITVNSVDTSLKTFTAADYNFTYDNNGNLLKEMYYWTKNRDRKKVWQNFHKYDKDGRIIEWYKEQWNDSSLQPYEKISYDYNDRGQIIRFIYGWWRASSFYNIYKDTCIYDNEGRLLEATYFLFINKQWHELNKYCKTYDSKGRILTEINSSIEDYSRITYTYDKEGRLTVWLKDFFCNGAWMNKYRRTYYRNGAGQITCLLSEILYKGAWEKDDRINYNYTESGKLASSSLENWYKQWKNVEREIYTYDDKDSLRTVLYQSWKNNDWGNDYRETYSYDQHGNLISFLHEYVKNNSWNNGSLSLSEYDANGNTVRKETLSWVNGKWEPITLDMDISYNNGQGTYTIRAAAAEIEYVLIKKTEPELKQYEFSLIQNYPNPFNPTTTISYEVPEECSVTLKVYDPLGKEVKELVNERKTKGKYHLAFSSEGLKSGVYFYTIKAGRYISTRKMILMK